MDEDQILEKEKEKEKSDKTSKFNAGINKLERINKIRYEIIDCQLKENVVRQSELLSAYFTELIDRMNKEEVTKAEKFEKNIDTAVAHNITTEFNLLDGFYRYLATIEHKYGLGLPDKDSTEPGKAVLK
jgi:hypothetical protein